MSLLPGEEEWVADCAVGRKQERFVEALFGAYLEGRLQGVAEGQHKFPEGKVFAPFAVRFIPPCLSTGKTKRRV